MLSTGRHYTGDISHLNVCCGETVRGLGLHLSVGRETGQTPVSLPARQADNVDTATRGEDDQSGGQDGDDEVNSFLIRPWSRHLCAPLPLTPWGGHSSGKVLEGEGYVVVTVI